MHLVFAEEMRQIEEEAIQTQKISLFELMLRAGEGVAKLTSDFLPPKSKIAIFCGKGNNGGDGFVAAKHLQEKNYQVAVVTIASASEFSPASQKAFTALPPEVLVMSFKSDLHLPWKPDLVVDALLGFGLKGEVKGLAAQAIKYINQLDTPVLAVDIPSGVESDTGKVTSLAVKAAHTITFTVPKVGLLLYPGATYAGQLHVEDIGISRDLIRKHAAITLTTKEMVQPLLPRRHPQVHKRECGQVLVIAGSVGMTGAAAMTAQAALRAGAGVVTLALPESLNDLMEVKLTEVMTIPLPETGARSLDLKALDLLLELASNFDVVAIGPGLSLKESTPRLVEELLKGLNLPVVVDADALNAMVDKTQTIRGRTSPTVMTPHPGELSRLLKVSTDEIQADRIGFAREAASRWQATVLLKGARTIICGEGATIVNSTGNPGMASAGTGDVLTGIIAAFLAQGLPPFPGTVLGTYLHGLAGDLAAKDKTELAIIAGDLIEYLPKAIRELEKDDRGQMTDDRRPLEKFERG